MIRRNYTCQRFVDLAVTSQECILRVVVESQTVWIMNPSTGVAVYSRLKDIYCEKNSPFTGAMNMPMTAITPELFIMEDGWRILNPNMMYNCSFTQEEVR